MNPNLRQLTIIAAEAIGVIVVFVLSFGFVVAIASTQSPVQKASTLSLVMEISGLVVIVALFTLWGLMMATRRDKNVEEPL